MKPFDKFTFNFGLIAQYLIKLIRYPSLYWASVYMLKSNCFLFFMLNYCLVDLSVYLVLFCITHSKYVKRMGRGEDFERSQTVVFKYS